jgi:hypothetical protein
MDVICLGRALSIRYLAIFAVGEIQLVVHAFIRNIAIDQIYRVDLLRVGFAKRIDMAKGKNELANLLFLSERSSPSRSIHLSICMRHLQVQTPCP